MRDDAKTKDAPAAVKPFKRSHSSKGKGKEVSYPDDGIVLGVLGNNGQGSNRLTSPTVEAEDETQRHDGFSDVDFGPAQDTDPVPTANLHRTIDGAVSEPVEADNCDTDNEAGAL